MAINLASLAGKLARADVEFMGQSCRVQFDPLRITAEWMERTGGGSDEAFAEGFIEVVRSWDVMETAKKKVPLTLAGLKKVPLPLLKAIYSEVVFGSQTEVEDEGKASSDG